MNARMSMVVAPRRRGVLLMMVLCCVVALPAFATSYTSNTTSGDWASSTSWSPVGVPTAGDTVTIQTGHTISMISPASAATVIVNSGGTINTGTASLTISNGLTDNGTILGNGVTMSGSGSISGTGTISCPLTVNVATSSTIASGSSLTLSSVVLNGGIQNSGTVTITDSTNGISGTGTWTQAASSVLSTTGPISVTSFSATASSNSVTYSGATQTVRGTTYYNLGISGSGIKTLGAAATVSHDLSVNAGTLADGGFQITGGSGTLTMAAATTLSLTSTGSSPMPTFNTYALGAFSSIIYAANANQTVATNVPYATLIVSGSSTGSYTKTLAGDVTTVNSLEVNQSGGAAVTLNTSGFNVTVGGDLNGGGTINQTGTSTLTVNGNVNWTGSYSPSLQATFVYGGTTASRTLRAVTYNHLSISTSGNTVTAASAVGVNGDLSVTAGTLALGTNTLDIGLGGSTANLYVDGTITGSGTFSVGAPGTIDGTGTIAPPMIFSLGHTVPSSASLIFSSNVSLAAACSITNSGTVAIGGNLDGGNGSSWVNSTNASVSLAGTVFATSGTLTASASGNTVAYAATGAQTVKPVTYYHLSISNSGTKTLTGVSSILGNFTIAAGATASFATDVTIGGNLLTGSATSLSLGANTIHVGGNWDSSIAAVTTTGSTVDFNGASAQTITPGATQFNNVQFQGAGAKTIASSVTINGNVSILSGAVLNASAGNVITVGGNWSNAGNFVPSTSTVLMNGSGKTVSASGFYNFTVSGTITAAGDLNVGHNFVTSGGTFTPSTYTVNFTGSTGASLNGTFYNVVINKPSSSIIQQAASTIGGSLTVTDGQLMLSGYNLTVTGDVSTAASASIDGGSSTFTIGGNVTHNGAFSSGTGTVVLNGASAQSWSGSSLAAFYSLTITGSAVTFNNSATVATALTLNGGNVTVATGKSIATTQDATTVTSSNASYILGTLTLAINSTASHLFYVGTVGGAARVSVSNASGSGSISVTANAGMHPNASDSNLLTRYWTVSSSGITSADVVFNYNLTDVSGNESAYTLAVYNGGWTTITSTPDAVQHKISATGVTALNGLWTAGEPGSVSATCVNVASLVSWWRAEGAAVDYQGVNNGKFQGSASTAAGKVGQAFSLNGTTDYISVPDNTSLHLPQFSLETWVKFSSVPTFACFMCKLYGSTTGDSFALYYQSGQLRGQGTTGLLTYNWTPTIGTWYHVVYTNDGANEALYLDGAQVAAQANNAAILYDTGALLIGNDKNNGSYDGPFPGLIDEASIYNAALTSSQVASLYSAGALGKCYTTPPAPAVSSINPASGSTGTSVTISGTNFISASNVAFNGTAATFTVDSATQITATVPAGATTGLITITTAGGNGSSAGNFTVGPTSYTATQNGNWSNPVTWGSLGVPGAGDTATINGMAVTLDSNVTIGTLNLDAGVINGSYDLTATTAVNWTGGTVSGSGSEQLIVPSGSTLTISGASSKSAVSRRIYLAGSGTWNGTGNLQFQNAQGYLLIASGGTFDIQNTALMNNLGSAGTLTIAPGGTLKKTSAGTSSFIISAANNGTVDLQNGTLDPATFTNAGAIAITSPAIFEVNSDQVFFNTGTTVTGTGKVSVTAANLTVNTAVSVPNLDMSGGTIDGTSDLTVASGGAFNWSAGTLSGTGTPSLNIDASATLNITGVSAHNLVGRRLAVLSGASGYWTGTGTIAFQNANGYIWNNGILEIQNNAPITDAGSGGTFTNLATLRKTTNGTTSLGVSLSNSGTIEVTNGGTLDVANFTNSGTVSLQTSASTLLVDSNTTTFATGTSLPGPGPVWVNGGTLTVTGASITIPRLDLSSGTLNGTGGSTTGPGGVWNWTGGTMSGSGTEIVTIDGTGTLTISGSGTMSAVSRRIANYGSVLWTGAGSLQFQNANGYVDNHGIFEIQSTGSVVDGGSAGTFTNASGATLRKTISGTTSFGVPLSNAGTLDLQNGVFMPVSFTNTGTIGLLLNTTTLYITSGTTTLGAGTTFTGSGLFSMSNGTVTATANVSIPRFDVSGGLVNGSGTFTVPFGGIWNWNGGSFAGTGSEVLAVSSGAALNISVTVTLSNRRIDNAGTVNVATGGTIQFLNGNAYINNSGTVISGGNALFSNAGSAGAFVNNAAGTFQNTSGTTTFGVGLTQNGVIDLVDGTLAPNGGITIAPTSHVKFGIGGGTAGAGFGRILSTGAVNLNNCTVTAYITNGYIPPGGHAYQVVSAAPVSSTFGTKNLIVGARTFTDSYTSTAATLTVSGPNVTSVSPTSGPTSGGTSVTITGTGFAAGATVTFGGTNAAAVTVNSATSITATTPAHASGAADVNVQNTNGENGSLVGGFTFTAVTSVDLSVTAVATPGSGPLNTIFAATVTVANGSGSPASNVVVTSTLPTGLGYVSSSPAICTAAGNALTCTIGALAPGGSATVQVNLQGLSGGLQTATFTAASSDTELTPGDNSDPIAVGVAASSTLAVTSNADSGAGTLREALDAINAGGCIFPCTVTFNLPSGQRTITVVSDLPLIMATGAVVIDGTSQGGYVGTPLVEIVQGACSCSWLLGLDSANITVKGLALDAGNTSTSAIYITASATNAVIKGNYIGLAANGTAVRQNGIGIEAYAPGLTVGGTAASDRNVISNNLSDGIYLSTGGAGNASIVGNYIGTDVSATISRANTTGISIDDSGSNLISGNVISGNTLGIELSGVFGANTTGNVIKGNYIGTTVAGSASLPNTTGISIEDGATGTVIGGSTAAEGNVIGGNSTAGITFQDADGNTLQSNYIGTNSANTNLANGTGVFFDNQSTGNAALSNTIAWNGNGGIRNDGTGNRFLANSLHDNTGGGILNLPGGIANDAGDGDGGPNGMQNWPQLVDAVIVSGNVSAHFNLDTTAANTGSVRIEIFQADPTTLQGKTFISSQCLAVAGFPASPAAFVNQPLTLPLGSLATGNQLVATATSYTDTACGTVGDGTSEFSTPVTITNGCTPPATTVSASGPTTFCTGGSVTLTAPSGAGYSYSWSNGATTQSITVSTTGNYFVTVTAGACSATSSTVPVTVTSGPSVTVTPSGPTSFCTGGTVTLTASGTGITGYAWSNGATTSSITVSTGGSYSVTVTNSGGCQSTSTPIIVTVAGSIPTPTIAASGTTTLCPGGSVTLTAPAGYTYAWSNNATTQSITVSTPGSYTVTISNGSCSATSAAVNVTSAPAPTMNITAGGPTTFCNGGSVTLTATPGFASYSWSNGATTQSITVSAGGTYTVTGNNGGNCVASASQVVTVNATPNTPSITASGPTTFCTGGSVTLSAPAGFTSYIWSNGATTQSITVNASGTFSVTVSNGSCPATSAPVTVTVSATPSVTITASGPTTFCTGGSVTLSAPAGFTSYLWSNGATTQSITVTASGSYSVTATNAGCSGTSAPTVVTVSPAPTVTITAGGPTTFCAGGSVTLTANGGSSWLWSNGRTTQSIVVTASGSYSVTASNGSCSTTSAPTVVTVASAPNTNINADPSLLANSTNNSAYVISGPVGTTYSWTIGNGTITAGQGSPQIFFTAGSTGSVTLGVTVANGGCSATNSITIPIGNPPAAATADLGVAISASSTSVAPGSPVVFSLSLDNNGPGTGTNAFMQATFSGAAIKSIAGGNGWNCGISGGSVNCTAVQLAANTSALLTVETIAPSTPGSVVGAASISSDLTDPNPRNNAASVSVTVVAPQPSCPASAPSLLAPADNATNLTAPVALSWSAVANATQYEVWLATGSAAPSLAGTTSSTSISVNAPSGAVTWYVIAKSANCSGVVSAQRHFTVAASSNCDGHTAPALVSPAAGSTLTSQPVTFTWRAVTDAVGYRVWISVDGAAAQDLGSTTTATSLTANTPAGRIAWFVEALFNGCAPLAASPLTFDVPKPDPCASHTAAQPTQPSNGATSTASSIEFRWNAATGASGYRLWAAVDGGDAIPLGTTNDLSFRKTFESGVIDWYVETLFDGCPSLSSAHSVVTIPRRSDCGSRQAATLIAPSNNGSVPTSQVSFAWSQVPGAIGYELWLSVDDGAPTPLGTTNGNVTSLTREVPAGQLEWFVAANFDGCPNTNSAHFRFSFTRAASCGTARPILSAPLDNAKGLVSPVTFRWSRVDGATSYRVLANNGGNAPSVLGTTAGTSLDNVDLPNGNVEWSVEAQFANCPPLVSTSRSFVVVPKPAACAAPAAPTLIAPSEVSSGVQYTIGWQPVANAASYQLQESSRIDFAGAQTLAVTGDHADFSHANDGATLATFFYRVRALSACSDERSSYSSVIAVGILPGRPDGSTLSGAAPAGDAQKIKYTIPLDAALAGQQFTATATAPWITLSPASGTVAAGGTVINVTADTTGLPLGTSLGGVTITTSAPSAGKMATNGSGSSSTTTVSVSVATPVTPTSKSTPPPDALIIPAVAHADGINSKFESDVRITNTSAQVLKYQLTFTPSGNEGIQSGRQATIDIEPGRTMALDDVLKSWFATGTTSTTGVLEIRPQTQSGGATSPAAINGLPNFLTFAASRTYNVTGGGTYGQFIPAVPFASFIGKSSDASKVTALTLQQIAQSADYRTNLGLVEGSGEAVSLLVSVFGNNGSKLAEFPVNLNGGQHLQMNGFLADRKLSLDDGRVEVKVTSGSGKVTAYASVVDNHTNDPLLVTPVMLGADAGATKYVIPGVADLNNGVANWRTDVRIFNNSSKAVDATVKFYSQNGGDPQSKTITLAPNSVQQIDSALATLFGAANDGGAIHITTPSPSNLVATARTFNQTTTGTFGQFISAVTPATAVANGMRPLQLLQVEESDRFRSNIGIAEVNGKTAHVEMTIVPPDSKATGFFAFDLAPNQFIQFNQLLKRVGMENTYNARITVKVTGGDGRVTAYASVIDSQTQDPTFVPAQ